MIYLGTYLISALFAFFATRLSPKKNKITIVVFSFIAILLPSLLAGMRATNIGTDIEFYLINNFDVAKSATSFKSYLPLIYAKEPLYLAIVYCCAKVFGNVQVLLFVISFLTILLVYLSAWKWKKYLSVPMFLLLYDFLYYNDSLNIIRQHLAMAILLLGIDYLLQRKYKIYVLFIIVASLIHTAALIGFVFVLCHCYMLGSQKKRKRKFVKLKEVIILFASGVGICGIRFWVTLAVDIGLLNSRYLYYFQNASVSNNVTDTLIYSLEIVTILLLSKQLNKYVKEYEYLKINAYLNIILLQLARIMNYGHRLSLYFGLINLLLIVQISKIERNKNKRLLINGLIYMIAIGYWIYIYCIGGVSQTFPYRFYFNK